MTLKTRRWLYSTFIAAFFVITTLVISYANGYTFSWTSGRLIKTGMFVLNTEPIGANIFLNGQKQTEWTSLGRSQDVVTPAKIKNLAPGEYVVKIEKPGYHSWQKKLFIRSGESTYAETVVLFSDTEPKLLSKGASDELYLDMQKNTLAFKTSYQAAILDLGTGEKKTDVVSQAKDFIMQREGNYFLLGGQVFAPGSAMPLFSLDKLIGKADDPQFVRNQDKLVYKLKDKLGEFDLKTQAVSTSLNVSSSSIRTYTSVDDSISLVFASSSKLFWQFYQGGRLIRSAELPQDDYRFSWLSDEWLALHSKQGSTYLVKINNIQNQIYTIKDCKKAELIGGNMFLCSNEYEIFTYDVSNNEEILYDRLSEPVRSIYWHQTNNYILFLTDTSVYSLELDSRDYRNKTKLADFEKITSSAFNINTNKLYISGSYKGQDGTYELGL